MMKRVLYLLRVLVTPSCWLQNYPYSTAWDAELRRLMNTNCFVCEDRYTALLDGRRIWISNHPYASFTPYWEIARVRPSRSTILEAFDKLQRDQLCLPDVPPAQAAQQGGE